MGEKLGSDLSRRVKLSRIGRIALWALRVYLIVLFVLIIIKFLRVTT